MTDQNQTQSAFTGLKRETITFWQGAAMIFGTNIGIGVLSLPYGARHGGFPMLLIALAVGGFFTTISMLYVAEVTLRTKTPLQLSGLAKKYLGNAGSWLIFAGVFLNGYGVLIAFSDASGNVLHDMFGIPNLLGTFLFFIPGVVVIWAGLKATGRSEHAVTIGMLAIILLLIGWTIVGPGIHLKFISFSNPYYIIPIMNLAVFTFLSQYAVPELARGFSTNKSPRALPHAIIIGMVATGMILALVPLAALGMMGPDGVTPLVTIAWGAELGPIAYFVANIFALLGMLTSFWTIGLTLVTNIFDRFKWPAKGSFKHRLAAMVIALVIPFVIGVLNLTGFVSVLGWTGGFAGAVMAIVPVMMLRQSRKTGDQEPLWKAGWVSNPVFQGLLIVVFGSAFIYSLLTLFGAVPAGWG